MLSYENFAYAQSVTPGDTGLYHLLGILAIVAGAISFCLIAILATPKARRSRELNFLRHDPFDDSFKREQAEFVTQVLYPEDGEEPPTIVPGDADASPLRAIEDIDEDVLTGTVVMNNPRYVVALADDFTSYEDTDSNGVLAKIHQSNTEFLERWGVNA